MSRIGRKPIQVPGGVSVNVDERNHVSVRGPKGELQVMIDPRITVRQEETAVFVERPDNTRECRSFHGLARTLINNCVEGVTKGHSKTLEIQGVGYRVQMQGRDLLLNMGYSHPVVIKAREGIQFELNIDERARIQRIIVNGIDKAAVGQVAADIRKVRKPDPYKGKGIRYLGEFVRLKAGKRATAGKK